MIIKKTTQICEFLGKFGDYSKPLANRENHDYDSKLTEVLSNQEDKTETIKFSEEFDLKTGKDLTKFCNSDPNS